MPAVFDIVIDHSEQSMNYDAKPELAIAALLHMMTRFAEAPKPCVAASIASHLQLIANDTRYDEQIRHAAAKYLFEWQAKYMNMFEQPTASVVRH